MDGKVIAALSVGVTALLLMLTLLLGGGTIATAQPPAGGCAITIPESSTGPTEDPGQGTARLDAMQMAAARTIVAVGKGLQVAERGTAIALGTAMQESALNPAAVNGRSLGLFQQQGAFYADVDRTDPADSARAFYRMLLTRVPRYADPDAVTFADAAQAVQASSAGPAHYARWERWATALAERLYDGTARTNHPGQEVVCRPGGGSGPIEIIVRGLTLQLPPQAGTTGELTFPNQTALTAAVAALSYLGTPYAWGGGTPNGPSRGIRDGGIADASGDYNKIGFDCSGLMLYAFAQAGITLPRQSSAQQRAGTTVAWASASPGDLLFWGNPVHHVALYLGALAGRHYMVEAPYSGAVVTVSVVRTAGDFTYSATRPY